MSELHLLYILLTAHSISAFVPFDTRLACADEDFMCQSGLCIPHNYVCNAINDCPNSEDENLLMCKNHTCFHNEFRCDTGRCIPNIWLCDGQNHCESEEDEEVEMCQGRECSKKEFRCNSGRCIPHAWLCDNTENCPDGGDERCGDSILDPTTTKWLDE